jgi:phospholipase C
VGRRDHRHIGSNGNPVPFDTHQGGVAMGFNNMSQGDAPIFKELADNYATSDNYHQAIMGGTGANFIFLGTAMLVTSPTGQVTQPRRRPIRSRIPIR